MTVTASLTPAQRTEIIRKAREENARAIAASRRPNGSQRSKFIEQDVADTQAQITALRREVDALREQVASLAAQVSAAQEDAVDARTYVKSLPAVQAPQAGGEAPWWVWVDRCHSRNSPKADN